MANTIQPSECSIFIQIWVDTNALQNGSTKGVYLVDSNHNNGSSQEGTTFLKTNATTNSKICWTILNTNINSDVQLSIANLSNASVFGGCNTRVPLAALRCSRDEIIFKGDSHDDDS